MKKFLCLLMLSSLVTMVTVSSPIYAQTDPTTDDTTSSSIGVAISVAISDDTVKNGDIISFSNKGYEKANKTYDQNVIGIVTDTPAITVQMTSDSKTYAVVSSGV